MEPPKHRQPYRGHQIRPPPYHKFKCQAHAKLVQAAEFGWQRISNFQNEAIWEPRSAQTLEVWWFSGQKLAKLQKLMPWDCQFHRTWTISNVGAAQSAIFQAKDIFFVSNSLYAHCKIFDARHGFVDVRTFGILVLQKVHTHDHLRSTMFRALDFWCRSCWRCQFTKRFNSFAYTAMLKVLHHHL